MSQSREAGIAKAEHEHSVIIRVEARQSSVLSVMETTNNYVLYILNSQKYFEYFHLKEMISFEEICMYDLI